MCVDLFRCTLVSFVGLFCRFDVWEIGILNDDQRSLFKRLIWKETWPLTIQDSVLNADGLYSLLYLECHFFNLKSQPMFKFCRSLWPRSVEKRPMRLRLESKIEQHSKCNRLYLFDGMRASSGKTGIYHNSRISRGFQTRLFALRFVDLQTLLHLERVSKCTFYSTFWRSTKMVASRERFKFFFLSYFFL